MPTYIIAAHGKPNYGQNTTIPAHTKVLFYQSQGIEMLNSVGIKIQTALAAQEPNPYNSVALWNSGESATRQNPEYDLTGDMDLFKSGIVRVDDNTVVYAIGTNALVTLSWALDYIRKQHSSTTPIEVHCLFCR